MMVGFAAVFLLHLIIFGATIFHPERYYVYTYFAGVPLAAAWLVSKIRKANGSRSLIPVVSVVIGLIAVVGVFANYAVFASFQYQGTNYALGESELVGDQWIAVHTNNRQVLADLLVIGGISSTRGTTGAEQDFGNLYGPVATYDFLRLIADRNLSYAPPGTIIVVNSRMVDYSVAHGFLDVTLTPYHYAIDIRTVDWLNNRFSRVYDNGAYEAYLSG